MSPGTTTTGLFLAWTELRGGTPQLSVSITHLWFQWGPKGDGDLSGVTHGKSSEGRELDLGVVVPILYFLSAVLQEMEEWQRKREQPQSKLSSQRHLSERALCPPSPAPILPPCPQISYEEAGQILLWKTPLQFLRKLNVRAG